MKLLVTPTSLRNNKNSDAVKLLEQFADEIVFNPYDHPLTEEEIIPLLDGVDGYIAGLDYITGEVIKKAPDTLKVISRYGVGFERVDTKTAGEKGIIVTNTPGANSESVADMAIGLMIAVSRKITFLDSQVKAGKWPRTSGKEIFKKTMGILGLGAIGKAVALRAKGFSMDILAYDPYFDENFALEHDIKKCTLEEVLSGSDFISLHLPVTESTLNIIDEDSINSMKDGVVIINTSRGGLINEQAAYNALKSGKITGLGLDAFEKEPPGISPLFEFENVIATPHAGAHTAEAVDKMALMSVQNAIDVLSGKECRYIVNRGCLRG